MSEKQATNADCSAYSALQLSAPEVKRIAQEILQYADKQLRERPYRITWANVHIMEYIGTKLKQAEKAIAGGK